MAVESLEKEYWCAENAEHSQMQLFDKTASLCAFCVQTTENCLFTILASVIEKRKYSKESYRCKQYSELPRQGKLLGSAELTPTASIRVLHYFFKVY